MVFDRSICYLPEDTVIEEKNIRCRGDIIISDRSSVKRGVITEGRIFLGEFVDLKGDLISIGDIRIDKGSRITGKITCDTDVFLGERCRIKGEIVVGRDLEIGEGVDIDPNTIDSRGFINIKNPISMILYILLYLLQMLKESDSEEVERFFKELDEDDEDILVSRNFTFIPKGAKINREKISIPGDLRIGPRSQIVSSLQVSGSLDVENEVELFGDIEAQSDIFLGENVVINGNVTSSSELLIYHTARIGGDIKARKVMMTPDIIVDGTVLAENGIKILSEGEGAIEEKIDRFEEGVDIIEGIID